MNRKFKKGLALVLALVMVFATTASVFADTNGTANVKFYIPTQYVNEYAQAIGESQFIRDAKLGDKASTYSDTNYVNVYTDADGAVTENVNGTLKTKSAQIDLSTINGWLVNPPDGFHGLYNYGISSGTTSSDYIPTVFDAIYKMSLLTGETTSASDSGSTTYGFDTYAYSDDGQPRHGIYFNKISNVASDCFDSYYDSTTGSGYWIGYSWMLYKVPMGVTFNPAKGMHDDTYLVDLYANNIPAQDGETYIMVYEYQEQYF